MNRENVKIFDMYILLSGVILIIHNTIISRSMLKIFFEEKALNEIMKLSYNQHIINRERNIQLKKQFYFNL